MLFKSVSAMVVVALAAGVSAEDLQPYKPLMKMSIHQMFGIGRRQTDGYQPTESTCSEGATCADACGAGYVTCASVDQNVHCFNPEIKQTCCPDQSGSMFCLKLLPSGTNDADLCGFQTPATLVTTALLTPRARHGAAPTPWILLPVLLPTA
jgi:hypothetical protein